MKNPNTVNTPRNSTNGPNPMIVETQTWSKICQTAYFEESLYYVSHSKAIMAGWLHKNQSTQETNPPNSIVPSLIFQSIRFIQTFQILWVPPTCHRSSIINRKLFWVKTLAIRVFQVRNKKPQSVNSVRDFFIFFTRTRRF